MKKSFFVVSVLLMSSCGSRSLDERFRDYVEKVSSYCTSYSCGREEDIKNVTIELNEEKIKEPALCTPDGIIKITGSLWSQLSETDKFLVIFHEIGHCVFNKEHNDATFEKENEKIPYANSIMNPVLLYIYKSWTDGYQEELLKEFFN